jgi:hypothetical protein
MAERAIRRRGGGPFVVSANDLRHGYVVRLGAGDAWVCSYADAAVLPGADAETMMDRIQADGWRLEVVDVHLVDVADSSRGPTPVTYKERIRADGPSIALGSIPQNSGDRYPR